MILAYEYFLIGGIFLCEVETEEEAFFEMRRFLEINHIISDETTIKTSKKNNGICDEITYKSVTMTYSRGDEAAFGIYYKGNPSHMELGDESYWNIGGVDYLGSSVSHRFSMSKMGSVCWCDEVAAYLADLKTRKVGSMQCR